MFLEKKSGKIISDKTAKLKKKIASLEKRFSEIDEKLEELDFEQGEIQDKLTPLYEKLELEETIDEGEQDQRYKKYWDKLDNLKTI